MLAQLLEQMQQASEPFFIKFSIKHITEEEYLLWQSAYTFDGLKYGIRYGQSFCNHFELIDHILFYTSDPDWCDTYIRKTYIK